MKDRENFPRCWVEWLWPYCHKCSFGRKCPERPYLDIEERIIKMREAHHGTESGNQEASRENRR